MSNQRQCATADCTVTIDLRPDPGLPKKRQRFCDVCAKQRRKNSIAQSRGGGRVDKRPGRRANRVRIAREWFCDWLFDHPCACGETDITVLNPEYRDPAARAFVVSDGIARGYTPEAIEAELVKCTVFCANCSARRHAVSTTSYRWTYLLHRAERGGQKLQPTLRERVATTIANVSRINGGVSPQVPRRPVPPQEPQPDEVGGRAVYQPQIPRASAADLQTGDVARQALPQEPADGGAEVDVGDVATGVTPGQVVGEAGGGGGPHDTVNARDQARFHGRLVNPGVVVGGRFIRPERKR